MRRDTFDHDGLRCSYVDGGGAGPALVLLHAHWMVASDFEEVMPAFADEWRVPALTRRALGARVGPRLAPYLARSMRAVAGGWALAFEPRGMLQSEAALNGDHWAAWLSHGCPALLVRGARSCVVPGEALAEMARRRLPDRLRRGRRPPAHDRLTVA